MTTKTLEQRCIDAGEVWRDVPGFEGHYQASTLGRIKSIKRKDESILKTQATSTGYRQLTLSKDGVLSQWLVHRIIALTFFGPPSGLHVNHHDGDKSNNGINNLSYVTRKGNAQHAVRELGSNSILVSPKAKFDAIGSITLLTFLINGDMTRDVARLFGMQRQHVGTIRNKKSWVFFTDMLGLSKTDMRVVRTYSNNRPRHGVSRYEV